MIAHPPIFKKSAARLPILVVCAWCEEDARAVPAPGQPVSHGICRECAARHFGVELSAREAEAKPAAG